MSEASNPLNLQELVARIERSQAETEKFAAEQRKLIAESQKFDRERGLMPWQIVVTALGAGAALFAAGAAFFKLLGP